MPRKIIAGNWKMNLEYGDGINLIKYISMFCKNRDLSVEVIIAPSFIFLKEGLDNCGSQIMIAAQNCSEYESGAYTGEVSATMLKSLGIKSAIIGHSERREYFGDGDNLSAKLQQCFANDITPILCVGEKLQDRKAGNQEEVVKNQLHSALEGIDIQQGGDLVVAYEPVWAIGTGETASAEQAQQMHSFIRSWLSGRYSENIAREISILYGGSVKPDNAVEIFSKADVNGGLIGGASLKNETFCELIELGDKYL